MKRKEFNKSARHAGNGAAIKTCAIIAFITVFIGISAVLAGSFSEDFGTMGIGAALASFGPIVSVIINDVI